MQLTSSLPRLVAVVALLFGWALPASAQVRPRILIAFDTSGSMGLDFGGTPTYGDGVTTGCSTTASGQCGTNCTAGIDTNCDGQTNDSRLFIAKNAVADMVRAYGEVDWGFARFQQTQGLNSTCRTTQEMECNTSSGPFISSFGNPRCNTGASCAYDWTSTIPGGVSACGFVDSSSPLGGSFGVHQLWRHLRNRYGYGTALGRHPRRLSGPRPLGRS